MDNREVARRISRGDCGDESPVAALDIPWEDVDDRETADYLYIYQTAWKELTDWLKPNGEANV